MDELVRVRKVGFACALAVAVGIAAAIAITSLGQGSRGPRETNSPLWEGYGELPLAFEPNRGQAEAGVAFVAHGAGSTVSLRPTEALLSLGKRGSVRLQINGANRQSVLVPERRLQGKVNYLLGNDRSRWLSGIPTYGRLRANAVYPGIDLVYYGRQGRLEYDFLVHPGADPRTISLALMGARSLRLEGNGDLRLRLAGGELRQLAPRLYQQVGGERRRVEGRFVVRGRRLGFAVGTYDRSRTLVIDPTLAYSTYLGGSSADLAYGIALDASGNAYVTGPTESAAFPTAGAYQGTRAGFGDAFVTKLNASGSALVYSTYLGGSRYESGSSIAVDAGGNAYITGSTSSTDFPTASPYQAAAAGAGDAFVTKLNATGSALVYSTYVGGADIDIPYRIAVDSAGNAYVTGQTRSIDFPTENSYQSSLAGFYDAFVTKLNATGSALVYSTYLGGGGLDIPTGVAVDAGANAYVAGQTASTNFPTASPLQAANGGSDDAFVTKLNASGSALVYSTYLGGSGADHASDVEVDTGGTAYVSGKTSSTNFPTVSPLQAANGGSDDAFVTKVNASGSALVYSTYLGGSSADKTLDIAVDSGGSAYVAGPTSSTNFPTASPFQPANAGGDDGFLSKLNASGSALVYSTYLGGNSNDYAYELAVDAGGNVYVAGGTNSANFPMANPYQTANAGDFDAFVTKFSATPTAVALRSFVARRRGSVVLLRWRTGSESDLLGFNVYRGRIRLNRALIPAGSGAGHSYSHLDRAAPRAVPLGYRLQSVARDGSRSWIGDASVPKSRRP